MSKSCGNKAGENIKTYSEDIEHVCVGNDCDDGSLSLYLPEEENEDGYDVVQIITTNPDNVKDEDNASLSASVPAKTKRKQGKQAKDEDNASLSASVPAKTKRKQGKQAKVDRVKCKHCHKLFRRNYIHIHIRIHTGERPYKCKLCPEDFNKTASLKYHMLIHNNERPFKCTVCGDAFRKKTALDSHAMVHTGARPYKCEICGKTFQRKGTRDDHYITHSDTKPFICPECPKRFSCNRLLQRHLDMTHAKIKPIVCDFCGKRFSHSHLLGKHHRQAKSCPGPFEASSV